MIYRSLDNASMVCFVLNTPLSVVLLLALKRPCWMLPLNHSVIHVLLYPILKIKSELESKTLPEPCSR